MIRILAEDVDGLPKVGSGFDKLGVRLKDPSQPNRRSDVDAVSLDELVQPTQGMSCSSSPPQLLVSNLIQPLNKKQHIWELDCNLMPLELMVIDDATDEDILHKLMVPRVAMPCRDLLQFLAATRPHWRRIS